jgi:hypothetical protein
VVLWGRASGERSEYTFTVFVSAARVSRSLQRVERVVAGASSSCKKKGASFR